MTVPAPVPLAVDPTSPVLVLHVFGVGVALLLAGYATRNRDYPGVVWFATWSLATATWLGANTVGLLVVDPALRTVVQSLAFAITPVTALSWFAFAMTYTGRGNALTPRRLRVLGTVAAALAVFAATNPVHGLVVAEITVEQVAGVQTITAFGAGAGFWLVNAYVYPLFFVGLVLLVELVLSGRRLYADQGAALLLASGLPLAAALLWVSGQSPVPVNLTPLASAVSAVPVAYAVYRSQLLDLVPAFRRVGERTAVHALEEGVLVLDPAGRVAVVNDSAAGMLDADPQAVRSRQIGELLEASPLEPTTRWLDEATEDDPVEGAPGVSTEVARGHPEDGTPGYAGEVSPRDGEAGTPADPGANSSADREAVVSSGPEDGAPSRSEEGAGGAPGGQSASGPIRVGSVPPRLHDARTGRIYSVTESPIDDGGKEGLGRTLVFRDVTEERRRKQRLLVLNRVVRHNLRNDMTVLLGHARMLASADESESLAVVEEIGSDLIGLGEKAQDIDEIIRQSTEPDRPVNVAGIVERVCVHERRNAPGVEFDVRVPRQAWTESHGRVIEAIVSNLVENAVKHGCRVDAATTEPAKGSDGGVGTEAVQARGGGDSGRPVVTVVLERRSDRLELVVADDGPGIPQQELSSVLEGEVSDLHHASGLGLWMVKWCVDLADARWTVDTESGTRVTVSLSRSDADVRGAR